MARRHLMPRLLAKAIEIMAAVLCEPDCRRATMTLATGYVLLPYLLPKRLERELLLDDLRQLRLAAVIQA